jgi:hypothetical protein
MGEIISLIFLIVMERIKMSEDEEEECEEENCEGCKEHQIQDKKQPKNMTEMLKKFGKKVKFGKDFSKGQVGKELAEFLEFSRKSVDKTFVTSRTDLSQSSLGMEKAFELLMKEAKDKHIDPESFTLGIIFGLSRWAFLEGEIEKKIEEAKLKKDPYIR